MRRLAQAFLEHLRDQRRARAAADENDLVDAGAGQLAVFEGLLHAIHGSLEERTNQFLVYGRRRRRRNFIAQVRSRCSGESGLVKREAGADLRSLGPRISARVTPSDARRGT